MCIRDSYLIANTFVEGDSLEICEEIDSKIMETDPRRLTDYTLEDVYKRQALHFHIHSDNAYLRYQIFLPFFLQPNPDN